MYKPKVVTPLEFVTESNMIENIGPGLKIDRGPTDEEMEEYHRFMALEKLTVEELVKFVSVYQPDAQLRDGYNVPGVRVGNHIAPKSCPEIRANLESILSHVRKDAFTFQAYETHHRYLHLHPFTDGNGRSSRMIWRWMMGEKTTISFLHGWYYASLDAGHRKR